MGREHVGGLDNARVIGVYGDIIAESRAAYDDQGHVIREVVTRLLDHEVPREAYADQDTGEVRSDWVEWAYDVLDGQDVLVHQGRDDLDEEESAQVLAGSPWIRAYLDGPPSLRDDPPMTHLRS